MREALINLTKPFLLASALCLVLGACQTIDFFDPSAIREEKKEVAFDLTKIENEFVREGLKNLQSGELDIASRLFNFAIKQDPKNSYWHMLNGLTYHLLARQGDKTKYIMAEIGYKQARRFDQANWFAAYQLGLLYYETDRYSSAQDELSYALLFREDDSELHHALAVVSYYAQDLTTAMASIRQAQTLQVGNPQILKAGALIFSAANRPADASQYLSQYRAMTGDSSALTHLDIRMKDWRKFHAREGKAIPAQFQSNSNFGNNSVSTDGATIVGNDSNFAGATAGATPAPGGANDKTNMAIIDVVIIRTEERLTTGKGVNLLEGLQLTAGGSIAYSVTDVAKSADTATTAIGTTSTTTLSPTLTIPTVTYSLNIANSADDRNEILARPSLVATDGKSSEFFSGATLSVALSGNDVSNLVDKDVGVRLIVTPQFLSDDKLILSVAASRSFFDTVLTTGAFNNSVQTSKTNVSANVVMKFGETLILSGLSERETEHVNSGVPLLKEIPLIQYAFSRETTLDFQKSVIVLLTPRKPEYVYQPDGNKEDGSGKGRTGGTGEQRYLEELQARHKDWFRPYPNVASAFHHIQQNKLYREFRTGDVSLEKWENATTLFNRLKRAIEFLHF